jgi:hypothetical protein
VQFLGPTSGVTVVQTATRESEATVLGDIIPGTLARLAPQFAMQNPNQETVSKRRIVKIAPAADLTIRRIPQPTNRNAASEFAYAVAALCRAKSIFNSAERCRYEMFLARSLHPPTL